MAVFEKQDGSFVLGEDDIINKKELMDWLGLSRSTIQKMMQKGLPHTRFRNYVAYNKYEIETWLEKNNYGPPELMAKWNRKKQEDRNNGN